MPGKRSRFSRRSFLRGGGALLFSGLATSRLRSAPVRSASSTRPNILLVFPDQLRFDWTALTGPAAVRTPNLVRLASEGLRFSRAICPAPVCAASRACLATGLSYGQTGVANNKHNLPDGTPTFYAALRDAGYRVGSVGKLDLRKAAYDWGRDGHHRVGGHDYFSEWGFTDGCDSEGKGDSLQGVTVRPDPGTGPYVAMLQARHDDALSRYTDWWRERKASKLPVKNYSFTKPVDLPDDAYNDNWVGASAVGLIESMPRERPWFLQVNFPGPHAPMDITESMAAWYRGTPFAGPVDNDQLPAERHTAIRRNYSAMVENIDRWLGRLLDTLDRRNELDRTIVAFSSDHGEMLGDHNRWAKQVPFHPSASVPLVVRGPGVRKGTHEGPTATLDLTATFLDYANARAARATDSRSLRPLLTSASAPSRDHVTSGLDAWRLAYDGRFKLIHGFDPAPPEPGAGGEVEIRPKSAPGTDLPLVLFDLEKDPDERTNAADRHPDIVARLERLLPSV